MTLYFFGRFLGALSQPKIKAAKTGGWLLGYFVADNKHIRATPANSPKIKPIINKSITQLLLWGKKPHS